jgi:hypothetical protein
MKDEISLEARTFKNRGAKNSRKLLERRDGQL